MNYLEWSENYRKDAEKILRVIEKKKALLKDASQDEKTTLSRDILRYRKIYYDLMQTACLLRDRAKPQGECFDAA